MTFRAGCGVVVDDLDGSAAHMESTFTQIPPVGARKRMAVRIHRAGLSLRPTLGKQHPFNPGASAGSGHEDQSWLPGAALAAREDRARLCRQITQQPCRTRQT